MNARRFAVGLSILFFASTAVASSADDLASPSQAVMDAAAKFQREMWVPPARTNWDSLLATLKEGIPRTNVLELLAPFKATPEGGGGSGSWCFQCYRLDDLWVLKCSYRERGDYPLLDRELLEQVRSVWLLPPTNFSGIWTTYLVNGQRENEIHCTNGRYQGEFTSFYSDGNRCSVQHFENGRIHGEGTGYFRSGHVKYRGVSRNDKQVGTWVWFSEDGSTNSVRDYSKQ